MDFLALFEFIFFSILFVSLICLTGFILRYKSHNKQAKNSEEQLIEPSCDAKIQFIPGFLIYAICFLIFDAQCVLMFPFAYMTRHLDIFCIVEIMIFVLILILSLLLGIKSELLKLD